VALDERLIAALRIQSSPARDLEHEAGEHVVFQASTIAALLDGAYDGDVSFAELAEHGDHGLGTLNGLDGEMIAVDGGFYRADASGSIEEVNPAERTPFAVLTWFEPTVELRIDEPLAHDELIALMEEHLPAGTVACAVRVDGAFELVHARSVPRQEPPYRPLSEVVGTQTVFDLRDVEGTIVGFRFPDYGEGLEVSGYHLHFVTADGARGGHVLEARLLRATIRIDVSTDLHVELPPGVELSSADASRQLHQALERAEHSG